MRLIAFCRACSAPAQSPRDFKTAPSAENPSVDSVTSIWPTANWHEREVYDLMGVRFVDHPDLARIMMPDDWEGHPLRKDYPLGGEEVTFTDAV